MLRESFEYSLLNYVVDIRIISHLRLDSPPKRADVRFDQGLQTDPGGPRKSDELVKLLCARPATLELPILYRRYRQSCPLSPTL
jgi:hypothetical protein